MISNPKYGWCDFKLGYFNGKPSYLTNVPIDLLDAFIDYHTRGNGVAIFDEEGTYFTLILTEYNHGIFIIEDKDQPVLHDFSDMPIKNLEKELIADIETDLNSWVDFITDDNFKISEWWKVNRDSIKQKITRLKKFI